MAKHKVKKEIALWDGMANSFHVTSSRSRAHKEKYQKVAELIVRDNKNLKILDLGCGSGLLERNLYDLGFKGTVLGIDASTPMVEIAKSINLDNKSVFEVSNVETWRSIDKFDVIVAINIMFFLSDKIGFLKNVSNSMGKDSTFILINPKPDEETSNLEFIKAHFSGLGIFGSLLVFINEISNIPFYIKLAREQKKLSKLVEAGDINFDMPQDIEIMAKAANLDIISIEDIHAKQNWMFVMRRV